MKSKIVAILTLLFTLLLTDSFSQKMSIGFIFPAGGHVGTTFDIEIGGLNISQATGIYISGAGVKAEIIKEDQKTKKVTKKKFDDQSSPQLADRLKVRITIDSKAITGLRELRLQASKSVSNKLSFEVGQFPDVIEKGISSLRKPNEMSQLPATFCGQIMPGERDYFTFKAQKGSKLIAACKARAFVPYIADAVPGWFQAVLTMYNSKGREIAFNDDFRGNVDPVIIYEVPENDTYTLMIHDAIFRGREDFNYRIDVGEIPFIEYIYPAVGQNANKETIRIKGVNIDQKTVKFKPDFIGKGYFTAKGTGGFVSNPIPFLSIDKTKSLSKYSNKMLLDKDMLVSDSLQSNKLRKEYLVDLLKNETFVAEITARKIGSMLDARLTLYDLTGKKLAVSDDTEDAMEGLITHHADPILKYKSLSNSRYMLIVEDVLQGSGLDYFYLLERKTGSADYEVFVSPANITIPRGGTATFMLDIVSDEKKIPQLSLEIQGLPRGFKTSSLEVKGNKWEVSISAPENAKEQKIDLKVLSSNQLKGKNAIAVKQQAVAADNMMQAFYYTHHIPAVNFIADVVEEAPFSLHFAPEVERNLDQPIIVSPYDSVLALKLNIRRKEGFNEKVALQIGRKMKQISLNPVEFLPNETEKTIYVKLNLKDMGKFNGALRPISIVGTVNGQVDKKGKKSFENALYRETTPIVLFQIGN